MKVLFNVLSLLPPRTGIGLYTQHLITALDEGQQLEELLGFQNGRRYDSTQLRSMLSVGEKLYLGSAPSKRHRSARAKLKVFIRGLPGAYQARQAAREWLDGRNIRACARARIIYHEPSYIPVRYDGPMVITAHDLSQVRHPDFHPPERAAFLNKNLGMALQRADQVITDSFFSAQEIMDVYQTPSAKLSVAYLGADSVFHPRTPAAVADTLNGLGLRYRGFVLFVATLEPRKNIVRLIDAFSSLPNSLRREFPLVLTGAAGWQDSDILRKIKWAEERGEVIRTGYVPSRQLADLFASAALITYPSLYEGFGLPILEGFASGTPVLTSNIGAMQEVSAHAAIEVDPYSAEAIADGIKRLLEDRSLADKNIQAGLIRSRDFSWRNCAEQTLEVYKKLS